MSQVIIPSAAGGKVLGSASLLITAPVDCTAGIPFDNTIPQITEGTQIGTLAYTPVSAASTLLIFINIMGVLSASGNTILALFQDAIANALAATAVGENAGGIWNTTNLHFSVASASTTARTYKIRGGPNVAHWYISSDGSGGAMLGGVCTSSIIILEVAP